MYPRILQAVFAACFITDSSFMDGYGENEKLALVATTNFPLSLLVTRNEHMILIPH